MLPPDDATEEEIRASRDRTVLKRLGRPENVTRALLYLIENDYVTGETLVVDGGRMLL